MLRRRLGAATLAALGLAAGSASGGEVRTFRHWAVVVEPRAGGPVRAMMVSASVTGTGLLAVRCGRRGIQYLADWLRPPPPTRYSRAWLRVDDRRPRTLLFRRTSDLTVTFLEPFPARFLNVGIRSRVPELAALRRVLARGKSAVVWIRSLHGQRVRARFSLRGFAPAFSHLLEQCAPG